MNAPKRREWKVIVTFSDDGTWDANIQAVPDRQHHRLAYVLIEAAASLLKPTFGYEPPSVEIEREAQG